MEIGSTKVAEAIFKAIREGTVKAPPIQDYDLEKSLGKCIPRKKNKTT